jgi:hypothetical protein
MNSDLFVRCNILHRPPARPPADRDVPRLWPLEVLLDRSVREARWTVSSVRFNPDTNMVEVSRFTTRQEEMLT